MNKYFTEKNVHIVLQGLGWLALLGLSIWYYKERTCYGDASYIIMEILKKQEIFIVHHRYTLILTYFIPLMMVNIGIGLKPILIAYSANQIVSTFLIALSTMLITKEIKHGWLFILAQVFWVHKSFYYFNVESISFMFPVAYFLISLHCFQAKKMVKYAMFTTIVGFMVLMSSPNINLLFLMVNFLLFFIYVKEKPKTIIGVSILFMLGYLYVKWQMPYNAYEQGKFEILVENFKNYKHLDQAAIAYYFRMFYKPHMLYILTLIALLLALIYKKKWYVIGGGLIALIVSHYLLCIYLYQWETNTYMEMYYQVVGILFCMLVYYAFSEEFSPKLYIPVFALLVALSLCRIQQQSVDFTNRTAYLKTLIADMQTRKVSKAWLLYKDIEWPKLMFDWSMAFETALLSTLYGNTVTILGCEKFEKQNTGNEFYARFSDYNDQSEIVSDRYFNLKRERYIPFK